MELALEKKAIRKKVLALRSALSEEQRAYKSDKIRELCLGLEEFRRAQTVMLFLDFRDEVETTTLAQKILEMDKRLVLPLSEPKGLLVPAIVRDLHEDLEPGAWGIREPKRATLRVANPQEIDLVIMPGVAFDMKGNRLGYGGGYYDRFIEKLKENTPLIALAFSCQVIEDIPLEPFDKKIDMLITEDGIHKFLKTEN